jgi:hypothetical protein
MGYALWKPSPRASRTKKPGPGRLQAAGTGLFGLNIVKPSIVWIE